MPVTLYFRELYAFSIQLAKREHGWLYQFEWDCTRPERSITKKYCISNDYHWRIHCSQKSHKLKSIFPTASVAFYLPREKTTPTHEFTYHAVMAMKLSLRDMTMTTIAIQTRVLEDTHFKNEYETTSGYERCNFHDYTHYDVILRFFTVSRWFEEMNVFSCKRQ